MLHLLTAHLVSFTCPQSISLVFIVPSKGKLGKEESKTSLVGMRCYGLIGILGVSCRLQRCRLKMLCWSQANSAGGLLYWCDDRPCCAGHCGLTRKWCSECVSRGKGEEKEVFLSPSYTVRPMAMKTALGMLNSTQDRAEEHQTRRLGTPAPSKCRVGQTCAQISLLPALERGFKPSSLMCPSLSL